MPAWNVQMGCDAPDTRAYLKYVHILYFWIFESGFKIVLFFIFFLQQEVHPPPPRPLWTCFDWKWRQPSGQKLHLFISILTKELNFHMK